MKRIRIWAALVIIVIVFVELGGAAQGFVDGWNEAEGTSYYAYSVNLSRKTDTTCCPDSVTCLTTGERIPYLVDTASVRIPSVESEHLPIGRLVMSLILILGGCLALFGIYCLIRLVLTVTRRGEVFTRKNVWRMRFFIYSVLFASLCLELEQWMSYSEVAASLQFDGYQVAPYHPRYSWMFLMLLALFTEIFAVGVEMKEEQDLTV